MKCQSYTKTSVDFFLLHFSPFLVYLEKQIDGLLPKHSQTNIQKHTHGINPYTKNEAAEKNTIRVYI